MEQHPDDYVPTFFDKIHIFLFRIYAVFATLRMLVRNRFDVRSCIEELDDRLAKLRREIWRIRTERPKDFK